MIVRFNALHFPSLSALALALGLAALTSGLAATPATAQFVCDSTTPGGADGATATGTNSVACGTSATASGVGAAAFGNSAVAFGDFSSAIGVGAQAVGDQTTAVGNGASAGGANATATGVGSVASGNNSSAFGRAAQATGTDSIAVGRASNAAGSGAIAIGTNSIAGGTGSIALGQGTQADGNGVAIGNGVSAQINQVAIGTAMHTYTFAGITSAASTAAQSGPLSVVTTDANGNLAAVDPASLGLGGAGLSSINSRLDEHDRKISKNTEGVAIALAMAGVPTLTANETFAMSANWGTFEGENGFAGGAAIRLDKNVQLNGGLGFGNDSVGGRAGVRIGW